MAKINPMPPMALLQSRFAYEADTGRLIYRNGVSQRRRAGDEAGFVHYTGYRYVKLLCGGSKLQVAVHRIAWALANGECPPPDLEIDHIDRNKLNNTAANLRLVTRAENARNTIKASTGPSGVSFIRGRNRWRAYAYVKGKYVHLGSFKAASDAEMAVNAFVEASRR